MRRASPNKRKKKKKKEEEEECGGRRARLLPVSPHDFLRNSSSVRVDKSGGQRKIGRIPGAGTVSDAQPERENAPRRSLDSATGRVEGETGSSACLHDRCE
ncbi:unnamed protein product [Pleuronectes platessa]|uniref:Uncharacterized protein n=1 Tax=Pleuronectes platessa TaxID=8262 RepID=A0A9N7THJ4_PLEPL|nr:unnamed protein product [Pleuronectes platessa]